MTDLTPTGLKEMLERCERATEGDWYVNEVRATPHNRHEVRCRSAAYGSIGRLIADLRFPSGTAENAAFIARARTDLPAVVKALLEANARIADLTESRDSWRDSAHAAGKDSKEARELLREWLDRQKYLPPVNVAKATREFLGGDDAGGEP